MYPTHVFAIFLPFLVGLLSVSAVTVDSEYVTEKQLARNVYTGCTKPQIEVLEFELKNDILTAVDEMARVAAGTPGSLKIYEAYFGTPTSSRIKKVIGNFAKTRKNMNAGTYYLDCGCTANTATIPNINKPFDIKICKRFWASPLIDNKAGAVGQSSLIRSDLVRFKNTAALGDYTGGVTGVAAMPNSS